MLVGTFEGEIDGDGPAGGRGDGVPTAAGLEPDVEEVLLFFQIVP